MAAFQGEASPVALLSEASSEGGTPPSHFPPRELTQETIYYHLTRIRMYDVTIEANQQPEGAQAEDTIRVVQRVFAYKKGNVKWVYSSKIPYKFIGRLVDGHDFIRLDYNTHFGIKDLPPPPSPLLDSQDSLSSSKSAEDNTETEVCR